jgi:2-phosphosulfolactate phosphatase
MELIETCFSPLLYDLYKGKDKTVVIIDVLRATSSICAAIKAGAKKILPVATIEQAYEAKQNGYILAAERDGKVLDFADFGNSPDLFTPERVKDKVIAYSTTNGTQTIELVKDASKILIGSFVNLSVLTEYMIQNPSPVVLVCSGWKNKFCLEDTLCSGAIAEILIKSEKYNTFCDSTHAAIDLWNQAKPDLLNYLNKASHRHRLKNIVSYEVIKYCFTIDIANVLPYYDNGFITRLL